MFSVFIYFCVLIFLCGGINNCHIRDDSISPSRFPLFLARDVMRLLIDGLHARSTTAKGVPT